MGAASVFLSGLVETLVSALIYCAERTLLGGTLHLLSRAGLQAFFNSQCSGNLSYLTHSQILYPMQSVFSGW